MGIGAVCHNCRKWDGGSLDVLSTEQPWMYAFGPSGNPVTSDSPTADLTQHFSYGNCLVIPYFLLSDNGFRQIQHGYVSSNRSWRAAKRHERHVRSHAGWGPIYPRWWLCSANPRMDHACAGYFIYTSSPPTPALRSTPSVYQLYGLHHRFDYRLTHGILGQCQLQSGKNYKCGDYLIWS